MTPSADGTPIRYESFGHGDVALVFVHGWSSDRHLWDEVVPHFASRYRVVTLDLAGHGESGRNRTSWTIEAFGEDVAAVVRPLAVDAAILIGHSMGGSVILEAARRLPERVRGLVPVDTLFDVENRTPEEVTAQMEADLRHDFAATVERFTRQYMLLDRSHPELVMKVVGRNVAARPEIAIPCLMGAWRYDPKPALRDVRVPAHAVQSDRFATNVEANRRYFASYDVTLMSDVGHYPMLEDAARFSTLLQTAVDSFA